MNLQNQFHQVDCMV